MIVGTGLYVLRYVSAATPDNCPFVTVNPPSERGHGISFMSMPGRPGDGLAAPGDCLVVRAERPGSLNLQISTLDPYVSLDAELRLERIVTSDATTQNAQAAQPARRNASSENPDVGVLAHVSRRGDVTSDAGEWICGPDLPMPIEGIAIDWSNKPSDVDLRYSVAVSRSHQRRVLGGAAGEFAGTRGKAMRIVGLDMALTGPGAADYTLRVEALFLGAPGASRSGRDIAFAGPNGREPLVGVRIAIVANNEPKVIPHLAASNPKPKKQRGQVRVYRPA